MTETKPRGRLINNRYRLQRSIGGGGMGDVYQAIDLQMMERVVAIKLLRLNLTGDPQIQEQLRQRFRSEAQVSALLGDHPNITKVLDFGLDHDQMYLAMEFLGLPPLVGAGLDRVIHKGPINPMRVVRLAQQMCAGLHYAHSFDREVNGFRIKGVIHRDIKPSNIFIVRDPTLGMRGETIKLLDFGVAKILSDIEVTMGTGMMGFVGTIQYSSPEQLKGKTLDARSDIYSLGVVIYRMLTGQLPLKPETDSMWAWIEAHASQPPIDLLGEESPHRIPEPLSQVVMTCLQKDPADRYDSMEVLSRSLEEAWQKVRRQGRTTTLATGTPTPTPTPTPTSLSASTQASPSSSTPDLSLSPSSNSAELTTPAPSAQDHSPAVSSEHTEIGNFELDDELATSESEPLVDHAMEPEAQTLTEVSSRERPTIFFNDPNPDSPPSPSPELTDITPMPPEPTQIPGMEEATSKAPTPTPVTSPPSAPPRSSASALPSQPQPRVAPVPPTASPPSPPHSPPPPVRLSPVLLGSAAVVLLVIVGVLGFSLTRSPEPEPTPTPTPLPSPPGVELDPEPTPEPPIEPEPEADSTPTPAAVTEPEVDPEPASDAPVDAAPTPDPAPNPESPAAEVSPEPDPTPAADPIPTPTPETPASLSLEEFQTRLDTAVGTQDWDQALSLVDQMIPAFPDQAERLRAYRQDLIRQRDASLASPTPAPTPTPTPNPTPTPTSTPTSTPTPTPIPTPVPTPVATPPADDPCVAELIGLGISAELAQRECQVSSQLEEDPCIQQLQALGVSLEVAQQECSP